MGHWYTAERFEPQTSAAAQIWWVAMKKRPSSTRVHPCVHLCVPLSQRSTCRAVVPPLPTTQHPGSLLMCASPISGSLLTNQCLIFLTYKTKHVSSNGSVWLESHINIRYRTELGKETFAALCHSYWDCGGETVSAPGHTAVPLQGRAQWPEYLPNVAEALMQKKENLTPVFFLGFHRKQNHALITTTYTTITYDIAKRCSIENGNSGTCPVCCKRLNMNEWINGFYWLKESIWFVFCFYSLR